MKIGNKFPSNYTIRKIGNKFLYNNKKRRGLSVPSPPFLDSRKQSLANRLAPLGTTSGVESFVVCEVVTALVPYVNLLEFLEGAPIFKSDLLTGDVVFGFEAAHWCFLSRFVVLTDNTHYRHLVIAVNSFFGKV